MIVHRRAEDDLLPWMDIAELQAMETLLRKTDTVLEYGAGGSTLWLAERVREVYVIEHDAAWATRILDAARANVHLICVHPETPHAGSRPAEDGQFRTYIEACEWPGKKVDVCLIDGRARVDVALRVAKQDVLKAQGYLFFHDWFTRARYQGRFGELRQYYRLCNNRCIRNTAQTMAVFRKRKDLPEGL